MRTSIRVCVCVAVALAATSFWLGLADAGVPSILSVIEGRESQTDRAVVAILGKGISSIRRAELLRLDGSSVGDGGITLKNSTTAVVSLPPALGPSDAGKYRLRLTFGKKSQDIDVSLGFGAPLPGALVGTTFSSSLLADLNDADTLGGNPPTFFRSASNLNSGTLSTSRFSAYDSLVAEGKIGGGLSQVASGTHNHDSRYRTQAELGNTGTINDAANPVDWTRLKGVPSGFADGVDDSAPVPSYAQSAASHYETISSPTLIVGRTLTFTKQAAATSLRIDYTDCFGFVVAGTGEAGASVRFLIDGADSGIETAMYRIGFSGEIVVPLSLRGVLTGVSSGSHTLTIQVVPRTGTVTFQAGAYAVKSFIEVDEF